MRNVHRFNPAIIFNANFTTILLQRIYQFKVLYKDDNTMESTGNVLQDEKIIYISVMNFI